MGIGRRGGALPLNCEHISGIIGHDPGIMGRDPGVMGGVSPGFGS